MALDPSALLTGTFCLDEVSKNIKGEVVVIDADLETCRQPACQSLTLVQRLRLDLRSADCDSDLGKGLDGSMLVRNLTTVFAGPQESLRGVHAGGFAWTFAGGGFVRGTLQGITNAGILRPPLRDCESCRQVGILTGHLFGTGANLPGIAVPKFHVDAIYRFIWDPIATVQQNAPVRGTLEGVIIMPCQ